MNETEPFKRAYDEETELLTYIFRHYFHTFTKREQSLYTAARIELQARHARTEFAAATVRARQNFFFDADVAAIVENGVGSFERQCCERLLRDSADQIYINRCERCNRIVATPTACLCLWCGHDWYERRAEMVARATSAIYQPRPQ